MYPPTENPGTPVAPITGAWIETGDKPPSRRPGLARSRLSRARGLKRHLRARDRKIDRMSRLSRARGLKRTHAEGAIQGARVAPITGAWIETAQSGGSTRARPSRLSRARGLKPRRCSRCGVESASRLSRARGLKRVADRGRPGRAVVAPITGAWIETSRSSFSRMMQPCRAYHGRVD